MISNQQARPLRIQNHPNMEFAKVFDKKRSSSFSMLTRWLRSLLHLLLEDAKKVASGWDSRKKIKLLTFQLKLKHFFLLLKTSQQSKPSGPSLVKFGIIKERSQVHLSLSSQKQEDKYLKFVHGKLKSRTNPKLSDTILSQPHLLQKYQNELFYYQSLIFSKAIMQSIVEVPLLSFSLPFLVCTPSLLLRML